jgi:gliding motility-associated-like protein
VPWYNDYYIIYKKNKLSGLYDSIGVSTKKSFTDTGLFNGENYCYKVKSYGYYTSGEGFVFPILNYSEEVCTFPVDTLKPCPPELMATAICDEMRTELKWTYSDSSCAKDVVGYKIYYSKFRDNNFSLIANVSGYNVRDYNDNRVQLQFSLAGCYKITAIDSFGNESNFSVEACVDNCPEYILPNVFSPNGDGINDIITPLSGNKYIDRVSMVIFNRWGQIVFETFDPQINWDGKDYETNIDCSEGTYYYICDVYQLYLEGAKMKTLHGTITLFR